MRAWEATLEVKGRKQYVTDEGDWLCCTECAVLVVNGRRGALAEKMTHALVRGELARSSTNAGVHGESLALLVRAVLDKVWANRMGPVEQIPAPSS